MRFIQAFGVLAVSAVVNAQDQPKNPWEYDYEAVNEDLSFGQNEQIWNKQNHQKIPGWEVTGEGGYMPEILSDRIILTPAHLSNKRGAIWSQRKEDHEDWIADFEFRATGPERGSGNLQIWYANDGEAKVGLSSLYTVGAFEGMVISISPYGKNGGSVRGFLNDGKLSYKDHHHVDRLAFGACDFPYRNVGHFSHVQIRHIKGSLEVDVNHKNCFKTNKVKLPTGYTFGATAASADVPDSIETKTFIISHDEWHGHPGNNLPGQRPPKGPPNDDWMWIPEEERIKDAPASDYKDETKRFQDLHDRVMLANHQADALFHDLAALKDNIQWKHDHLEGIIKNIETLVTTVKTDVEGKDYRKHMELLAAAIHEGNNAVLMHVPHSIDSAFRTTHGRLWFFAFIIIGSQAMLFASYVIYRRRVENQPKKFL